ncbi:histone acetyltransferase KAT2A [Platysternon megacephalum]|uniref:Histone acetyltransferase KAT2A n=1 Tax=Platysternon megacephalum TaxID=55544 RepID=A0A4D9ELH3_9SAUR|nr:histone acetyltransferase KAT2A [Platysternon megacephalum]
MHFGRHSQIASPTAFKKRVYFSGFPAVLCMAYSCNQANLYLLQGRSEIGTGMLGWAMAGRGLLAKQSVLWRSLRSTRLTGWTLVSCSYSEPVGDMDQCRKLADACAAGRSSLPCVLLCRNEGCLWQQC